MLMLLVIGPHTLNMKNCGQIGSVGRELPGTRTLIKGGENTTESEVRLIVVTATIQVITGAAI